MNMRGVLMAPRVSGGSIRSAPVRAAASTHCREPGVAGIKVGNQVPPAALAHPPAFATSAPGIALNLALPPIYDKNPKFQKVEWVAEMKRHSVLDSLTAADVRREPYPHVVIENCLPGRYFDELAATYPSNDTILDFCRVHPARRFDFSEGAAKQNYRYDISTRQVLEKPDCIPEIWRDFITHHTSRDFFQQVVGILGPEIRKTYPFLEKRLDKPLEELSAGVRWRSACDIYLDCQIGINTPATQVSSARGVHADAREELFAILLYFKDAEDDTAGGDLEIYRWRNPKKKHFLGSEADPSAAERVDTVPYKANTMVMFLNTQDSLHAVTPRAPSRHTRKLVNIIGEVGEAFPHGLFSRPKKKNLDYIRKKVMSLASPLRGS